MKLENYDVAVLNETSKEDLILAIKQLEQEFKYVEQSLALTVKVVKVSEDKNSYLMTFNDCEPADVANIVMLLAGELAQDEHFGFKNAREVLLDLALSDEAKVIGSNNGSKGAHYED